MTTGEAVAGPVSRPSVNTAQRRLVLISGPPAAGKTAIAGPLAAELGFALLAKDRIKETLHDWLGQEAGPAWSKRLGAASMELLWALAADAQAAVLEANFWSGDQRVVTRIRALCASPVEVHCVCPAEVCMARYAERALSRHAVHPESHLDQELYDRSARPVGLGPVVVVDTTRPVDIAEVASQVVRLLPSAATPLGAR